MRWFLLFLLLSLPAVAAPYPDPVDGDWMVRNFKFHTGETLPVLHLHYTTVGNPHGIPVLILHGTGGSGRGMLTPGFAGELLGPGQPLDTAKYFIILPDAIGAGGSSKPSDGLRAKFPRYNYDDMVRAQYMLLTGGLGVRHVRTIIGNSMGGMHVFLWAETYPDFADFYVPMAAQPTEMAARNWMTRRIMIETIRQDPAYNNGNYAVQPPNLRLANVFMGIATIGGTQAYAALAPTRAKADALVDQRLANKPPADANDFIWQWDASRDYSPEPRLGAIKAPVLLIDSADDERNPPETGVTERAMKKVKDGHIFLIPASAETRGHGTTMLAKFWKQRFAEFMATVPARR